MIMRKNYLSVCISILFSLLSVGCYPVHHGYKFDTQEDAKETLQMMVDRNAKIDEIVSKFGSPTFINSPINDMLCYASADGTKVMFNRFYNPKYVIMCISFENGVSKSLEVKKMEQIKKEKFVKYDIKFDKKDYLNTNERTNK